MLCYCTTIFVRVNVQRVLSAGIIGKSALADELGVQAVSHKDSLLTTSDGHVQIQFETKSDNIELVAELNCNGGDSAILADCVSQSVKGRQTTFDISLPEAGEYAVNVFARRKDDPTRLHHVHTYLVTSTQPAACDKHAPSTSGKAQIPLGSTRHDSTRSTLSSESRRTCRA